jgi:probable addiction module antidote protein
MTEKIKRWDTAEHLRSNEEIDAYLESSFADGDEKQIHRALDNATRARGILSLVGETSPGYAEQYHVLTGEVGKA